MSDVTISAPLTPPPSTIQLRPPTLPQPPSPVPSAAPLPPQFETGIGVQPPRGPQPSGSGGGDTSSRPPLSPPPTPKVAGKPAQMQQSPLRFLPFILGVVVLGLASYFLYTLLFAGSNTAETPSSTTATSNRTAGTTASTPATQKTLVYWGLWEPSTVVQEVLSDFEKNNPGIRVNYQMQSYRDYRDRLQSAVVAGRGPDIFRFHATWAPMLQSELAPMPDTVFSESQYQSTFYPAASQLLRLNGRIVGVPLMYEGLALLYNEDALRAASLQPPKTWAEMKDAASRLTIRTGSKIQRAGLAAGNATNTDHFADILALLIVQNGGSPSNPTATAVSDAVTFYTNFVKTDKVWDDTFPQSTIAFARGDAAMVFLPSWRIHEIKALNPNLKFGVVPVPQLTANKVAWASFWAEGVNVQSKNKTEAWQLLKYLSSQEVLRKLYSDASKTRSFGELYPRQDMAAELASDPYASAYLTDAAYAQGWYMSTATHDNGINDQMVKYYEDAITSVVGGASAPTALSTVAAGSTQLLRQYGLSTTVSTTP